MNGKQVRTALRNGTRVYCTLIVSTSPLWPKYVKSTGVDFVFIDTEHIPIDRTTLAWMCQTYRALGLPPMVRIPEPDPFQACMALDGGANGIIAPYVETPEQVKALVGAVKWRPLKGRRLRDLLDGRAELEPELKSYLEEWNADNFLVINIESTPALESLDEILSVPGVDAVQVGPHDLSCSLGVPEQYRHPRFVEAVRKISRTTREKGIGFGVHFWEGVERQMEWAREGANLISHHGDISIFAQAMRADIQRLREEFGETAAAASADVTI